MNDIVPSRLRFTGHAAPAPQTIRRSKLAVTGEAINHGVNALNAIGQLCYCLDELFGSDEEEAPKKKRRK